jgi:hypothetical protein
MPLARLRECLFTANSNHRDFIEKESSVSRICIVVFLARGSRRFGQRLKSQKRSSDCFFVRPDKNEVLDFIVQNEHPLLFLVYSDQIESGLQFPVNHLGSPADQMDTKKHYSIIKVQNVTFGTVVIEVYDATLLIGTRRFTRACICGNKPVATCVVHT